MRLFVGYGYNERDQWIERYVIPLVAAFGCDVKHGKAVFGGALSAEIITLIRSSDAMIGFTTRRDPIGDGTYTTHPWVVQELVAAHTHDIPFVEVREGGVIPPGGIIDAANHQRIQYTEDDRAICLLEIARALARFREMTHSIRVRLRPAEAVEQISQFLDDPGFTCRCQILRGDVESAPQMIPVLPIKGGLFVQLRGVAPEELVRIMISAGGRIWRSSYESIDAVDLELRG